MERNILSELYESSLIEPCFDMVRIDKTRTNLPYGLWIDASAAEREVGHKFLGRVKIINPKDPWDSRQGLPISIEAKPRVLLEEKDGLSQKLKDFPDLKDMLNFVGEHYKLFTLHYFNEPCWDDTTLGNYITCVSKRKMTKREALEKLLSDGEISEIPKEY